MKATKQISADSIWVSKVIDKSQQYIPGGLIFATVISLGALPIGLTVVFFILTNSEGNLTFVFSQSLVAFVAVLGAFLIRYYDRVLFPVFFEEVRAIVVDSGELLEIVNRYKIFFSKKCWLTAVPWMVLLVSAVVANIAFFQSLGVSDYLSVPIIVYLSFIAWFGLITGIGLHMVVTTIFCIREIGTLELEIDPLHPDGLGGLSNIGMLAIRTTMMNSIGALAIPLAFTLAAPGEYKLLIYAVVVVYILFILFSFFYPTIYINQRAEGIREAELEKRRQRIQEIREKAIGDLDSATPTGSDVEKQLLIQTLKEEFRDYQSVRLDPFTLSILTQL